MTDILSYLSSRIWSIASLVLSIHWLQPEVIPYEQVLMPAYEGTVGTVGKVILGEVAVYSTDDIL